MAKQRTQLNVRMDEDLLVRLRMTATIEGTSLTELIHEAVVDKLKALNEDPAWRAKRDRWLETMTGAWGDGE